MADRVPQFNMMPSNFNPGLAQHAQLAQQGQHQGHPDSQPLGGAMTPEQARMWQFLSQQQRAQGGGEAMGQVNPQMNQQMFDFMRSNNMARAPGQQKMGQPQQPLGMGPSQMNPAQQQFRDLQNASQQMHNAFNPNFMNAGPSNGQQFPPNHPQAQQSAQAAINRNNLLAQMASGQMRQLEMIGLAQNQQPQNGPAGMAARIAHQQQFQQMLQQTQQNGGASISLPQNQLAQGTFFPHPSMTPVTDNRPNHSPQVASQLPVSMASQQQPQHIEAQQHPQRPPQAGGLPAQQVSPEQLKNTFNQMRQMARNEIEALSNEIQRLQHVHPKTSDIQLRMVALGRQVDEKKNKAAQLDRAIMDITNNPGKAMLFQPRNNAGPSAPMNGGVGINSAAGPTSVSTPMPGQRPGTTGPPQQNQPMWPGQQNMMAGSLSNGQLPHGSPSVAQQLPAQFNNSQGNLPQNVQQPGMPQTSNMVMQRSVSAQGPVGLTQRPPVNPSAMNNLGQPPVTKSDGSSETPQNFLQLLSTLPPALRARVQFPIAPLETQKFRDTYGNFCQRRGVTLDERALNISDRSIDLHALHSEVTKEGGYTNVTRKDLWAVIGARMGFVHFHANGQEPAKASSNVAQHLSHVYRQYLKDFDDLYVQTILSSRIKQFGNPSAVSGNNQPLRAPGAAPNALPGHLPPTNPNRPNAQQLAAMMSYARLSVAEMRARGLPDHVINLVEQNRPMLMQQAQQHEQFRGSLLRPSQPGMPSNGVPPNMQQRVPSAGPGQLSQGQNLALGNNGQNGARPGPPQGHASTPGMPGMDGSNHAALKAGLGLMNGAPPLAHMQPSQGAGSQRPTEEQLRDSMRKIDELRKSIQQNAPMNSVILPEEHRQPYRALFDRMCQMCDQLEPRLPFIHAAVPQDELVMKLLTIFRVKEVQKAAFSSANPRFLFPLERMGHMAHFVQSAYTHFISPVNADNRGSGPPGGPRGPPIQSAGSPQPPMSTTPVPVGGVSPRPQPVPPAPSGTPARKKVVPPASNVSATSPAPPASASTPGASAATPITITNSPQLGKSPKPKATKPRAPAAPRRKPSIKASGEGGTQPSADATGKRKREEGPTPEDDVQAGSPPKKSKSEWEEPPSQDLAKRDEQADKVETDEDAIAFLRGIEDLMKKQVGSNGVVPPECSETLEYILKGYDGDITGADASSSGLSGALDPSALLASSPELSQHSTIDSNFDAFFDFSSFGAGDEDVSVSKAPTPDLVASSSANPSPESGADEPANQHAGVSTSTPKIADASVDDYLSGPLRLGIFGEVDGGESSFYSSDSWKWEGLMPTADPAWAISDT